jgi:hypothetical protein
VKGAAKQMRVQATYKEKPLLHTGTRKAREHEKSVFNMKALRFSINHVYD